LIYDISETFFAWIADVEQALHILDDLRLSESDDVELQTSLGDVLHVLTSPLFGALLGWSLCNTVACVVMYSTHFVLMITLLAHVLTGAS
jgi:hypothetical protein